MDGQGNATTGGVLQAADDLLAAVERFEDQEKRRVVVRFTDHRGEVNAEYGAGGGVLKVGVRVRAQVDSKLGVIETLDHKRFPLWPWGVRYDDGSFELCSATELAVVEAVSA